MQAQPVPFTLYSCFDLYQARNEDEKYYSYTGIC